jgi:hypothetical protein
MLNLASADTVGGVAARATYGGHVLDLRNGICELNRDLQKISPRTTWNVGGGPIYTVAASTTAWIEEIRLANCTSAAVAGVILYVGGTAAANQITGSFTIPANGTCIINRSGMAVLDSSGSNYVATTPSNLATSITAASAGINSAETSVVQLTIPANYIAAAGKTFLLTAFGVCTSSAANASNFRARIGTAGQQCRQCCRGHHPDSGSFRYGYSIPGGNVVTVRSVGSGGSIIGGGALNNNGVTGVSAAAVVAASLTATVSLNTTVQNILQLSYVAAASTTTCTFHGAVIQEVVK